MAGQAEAGDVGQRVHACQFRELGAGGVELGRPAQHLGVAGGRQLALLERRRQHADAERLAQHQAIAGLCVAIFLELVGMDQAEGDQAVDRFDDVDRMPASNRGAGFAADAAAAFDNLADDFRWQLVDRHADEGQRQDRLAAHGIDVGQGVGGGDAAEIARIVDHRGEEVGGGDQCLRVVEAVDGGVVRGFDADHQFGRNQAAVDVLQDVVQNGRRDLAAAAAAMGKLGQAQGERVFGRFVHELILNFVKMRSLA